MNSAYFLGLSIHSFYVISQRSWIAITKLLSTETRNYFLENSNSWWSQLFMAIYLSLAFIQYAQNVRLCNYPLRGTPIRFFAVAVPLYLLWGLRNALHVYIKFILMWYDLCRFYFSILIWYDLPNQFSFILKLPLSSHRSNFL